MLLFSHLLNWWGSGRTRHDFDCLRSWGPFKILVLGTSWVDFMIFLIKSSFLDFSFLNFNSKSWIKSSFLSFGAVLLHSLNWWGSGAMIFIVLGLREIKEVHKTEILVFGISWVLFLIFLIKSYFLDFLSSI